ncbi:hypothetical protein KFE98_19285 [bacterium SCSIO 12741]|nr:hypothetical protein KFE98_19285 [bacterium SCSIO 12741]
MDHVYTPEEFLNNLEKLQQNIENEKTDFPEVAESQRKNPSEKVVNNILNYSKALKVEDTRSLGKVAFMLN